MEGLKITKDWEKLNKKLETSLRRMFGYGCKVSLKKIDGEGISRKRNIMKMEIINEVRLLVNKKVKETNTPPSPKERAGRM